MTQILKPITLRKALLVTLVLIMASPLVGCGRKASLENPKDSQFPRAYPSL